MSARRNRHRMHGNPFSIRHPIETPDWKSIFGRTNPMAVDVGFGIGSFTLELAQAHPDWNVLGIEIRQHLVEELLERAAQTKTTNLYAMLANANVHMNDLFPDGQVAFVSVNFPDPWFKRCHQKRRVVNRDWLDALTQKLAPEGEIHVMTDYLPLAEKTRKILAAHPKFESRVPNDGFAKRSTTGINSERERIHLDRGEPIYRLHYGICSA